MADIKPLSDFERFARRLVEGSLDRLLLGENDLLPVARQLISEVDASEINGIVANEYVIRSSPRKLSASSGDLADAAQELELLLERYIAETNRDIAGPLKVNLIVNSSLPSSEFTIEVHRVESDNELTRRYRRSRADSLRKVLSEQEAYFIVGGKRHLAINKAVLTIGRQLDNDVVIESSSVSRRHAQVQWRYGQFILHDLSSRTGTRVNNHPVTDSVLIAGDVIEIGNIKLIFGEGGEAGERRNYPPSDKGDTKPLPPVREP